jgi:hypothetical protein
LPTSRCRSFSSVDDSSRGCLVRITRLRRCKVQHTSQTPAETTGRQNRPRQLVHIELEPNAKEQIRGIHSLLPGSGQHMVCTCLHYLYILNIISYILYFIYILYLILYICYFCVFGCLLPQTIGVDPFSM